MTNQQPEIALQPSNTQRFHLSAPRVTRDMRGDLGVDSYAIIETNILEENDGGRIMNRVAKISTSKSSRGGISSTISVCLKGSGVETFKVFEDYMKHIQTPCKRVTQAALEAAHLATIANHWSTHLDEIVKQYKL